MSRPRNLRVYFLSVVVAIGALIVLLREHRPSFLRPDLHLCAYVTTRDGAVTVVDLVKLKAVAHIPVGPGLSGMREHPTRPEILGISALGGFAWIFDARAYQVSARIPVGDRKSTRLNSSHRTISYAVFCLKKKNIKKV